MSTDSGVTARRDFFVQHGERIREALRPEERAEFTELHRALLSRSKFCGAVIAFVELWHEHEHTIVVAVGSWLAFAFLLAWTQWLDRSMTRCSRQRRLLATLAYAAVLALIWAVPVLLVRRGLSDLAYSGERAVAIAFAVGTLCVWLSQLWLAWRDARYHGRSAEPALRVLLTCVVVLLAVIAGGQHEAPSVVRGLV